jgi:hypothetical protein
VDYVNILSCGLPPALYVGDMDTYTFLYRCPTTGYKVQGLVADKAPSTRDTVYEMVTCSVCNGVHLVDPNSGHVLGAERRDHRTPELLTAAQ